MRGAPLLGSSSVIISSITINTLSQASSAPASSCLPLASPRSLMELAEHEQEQEHEPLGLCAQALNSLSKLLEARGKNVSAKTFVDDAAIVNEIRFFRDKDYRIIFGLFDQYMAVKVFCAVCPFPYPLPSRDQNACLLYECDQWLS